MQKCGFKALGTSSAAIAQTLGYQDGEQMSFDELVFMVKRILENINIPLTVDIEGGYSRDPDRVIKNIKFLYELGVVGVNLEDSVVEEKREILLKEEFSIIIEAIKTFLNNQKIDFFLNIRTDTYLLSLPNALNQTLERIELYQQSGADGIFVPCLVEAGDIDKICSSTILPINVMSMKNLPPFSELKRLGVNRISMGGFLYQKIGQSIRQSAEEIFDNYSLQSLFT